MYERKRTTERTCEECGKPYFTYPSSHVNKRPVGCSPECRAALRIRLHGKDCEVCGKRFYKSPMTETCSQKCRGEKMRSQRKPRIAKQRPEPKKTECLFCGKQWERRYRNTFCSRKCAKQQQHWESSRRARCVCGKATGEDGARCIQCKPQRIGEWAAIASRAFSKTPGPWEYRSTKAIASMRRRPRTQAQVKLMRSKRTWQSVAKSFLGDHCKTIDPWEKRAMSAISLLAKRRREN